jgi:hypothetical protein
MTRFSNRSRAALAKNALETFVRQAYGGHTTSELPPGDLRDAIADLIADLGHYADRRFRKRTAFTELVARGISMWSAERRYRCGEPEFNHQVHITIDEGGEP